MKIKLHWRFISLAMSLLLVGHLQLYARGKYTPPTGQGTIIPNRADKVTGQVTDNQGKPVPGVTVAVKGTTTGTTTDEKGNFTIQVNDQQVLVLSLIHI